MRTEEFVRLAEMAGFGCAKCTPKCTPAECVYALGIYRMTPVGSFVVLPSGQTEALEELERMIVRRELTPTDKKAQKYAQQRYGQWVFRVCEYSQA